MIEGSKKSSDSPSLEGWANNSEGGLIIANNKEIIRVGGGNNGERGDVSQGKSKGVNIPCKGKG